MSCTLWSVWTQHPMLTIPHTQYTLIGYSIAALRTNFYIKELGIMFDAGLSGEMCADHIFITHAHGDHTANIGFHLLSSKPDQKIQIYVPKDSLKQIDSYIKSLYVMSCNLKDESEVTISSVYDIIGVDVGIIDIIIKKKKFEIEIFACDHSVPCIAFGITEIRSKLKEEYIGLNNKEITEVKKKGINVTKLVKYPIFCYVGDTSKEVLLNPSLSKYSTIMIECTFLLEEDIEQSNLTKHMHWKYLYPYIKNHPNNTFVLYHFSRRYKPS